MPRGWKKTPGRNPGSRLYRQESSKETIAFNDILGQVKLIHKYRPFHSKTTEYIFFSSAWGTFSRIEHMLGHKKISINIQYMKTEIISRIFSEHNAMRLEVN